MMNQPSGGSFFGGQQVFLPIWSNVMKKENQLEIYKLLVGQLHYEGTLLWTRNQIFLVLNTAIIAIMNLDVFTKLGQTNNDATTRLAAALIGIVLCLLWLLSVTRSQAYYRYWITRIRSIEKQMQSGVQLFNDLHDVYFGATIVIDEEEFRFDWITRFASIGRIVRLVAWAFIIVWIGLVIVTLAG
jgi:NADH:ubiquinone oxidoreductase subunit 2 (subunit N)